MKHRLIQDDDSHWYVIPVDRTDTFREWVRACELNKPMECDIDFDMLRVDGPHVVTFDKWEDT